MRRHARSTLNSAVRGSGPASPRFFHNIRPMRQPTYGAMCLVILLGACDRTAHVSVAEGSSAAHLVVHIRDGNDPDRTPREVDGASFIRCEVEGMATWSIRRVQPDSLLPAALIYGVVPPGWSQDRQAERLGPGCYDIAVGGGGLLGGARVEIGKSGLVVQSP